jgi:hypothetical protein
MDEACRHGRVVKGAGGLVCADCGVAIDGSVASAPAGPRRFLDLVGVEPRVLGGMGIALVAAVLVQACLPFAAYVTRMLGCLAHEIGHAAMGWALGRPSIPSFDLVYGGGVTVVGDRYTMLILAYLAGIGWFLWSRRRNRVALGVIGGLTVAWLLLAYSDGWSHLAFIAAGNWGRLALGGVFLFRALTGVSVVHGVERWLYALIGWLQIVQAQSEAWALIGDEDAREQYFGGKGGLDNDWVILGDELFLRLETIAGWHIALGFAVPVGVWAFWRWRGTVGRGWRAVTASER